MKLLREAGDFPNKSVVEYATIKIEIQHKSIPLNMMDPDYDDEFIVQGVYASPTGRLSYKVLYLNSVELAEEFANHLHFLFKSRSYANCYNLKIEVNTTTEKVTATKRKAKHSAQVKETLIIAGNQ